ncbi:Colicin V production protein [Caulifigura coniformis]|uniref:Colicin V production protein n=1 Tax=Caulifigura coniformis TaxID=2527983 RepID=A0A517SFQ8_9PLAN|nr:CvpA family protein [Caulifigura coniformis]QDT54958.1 Colicin V production protein [Caulifigura coniformis]
MWYDIAVLGVLVFCMARGASRGLIWQLATIAGIILCLMFAETFSGILGPHISLQPPLNEWVTMFGAYLVCSFVAFGAARMLTKGIEGAGLKEYNSHLGAIFGLAKGIVVCLVATFFLATLDATHNLIANSKSGYYAAITMRKIHPIMPEKLHDALNRYIHSLDNIPGVGPMDHDHVVDPNVGLADAIRDAAKAVDDKFSNPFLPTTSTPPQYSAPSDPWGTQPQPSTQTIASQPANSGVSSIPLGARTPAQPYPTQQYQPQQYQPQPYQQPVPAYQTPAPSPGTVDSTDFWNQVRGTLRTQARQSLAETLENMDPATRQRLQQQILDSLKNTRSEDLPKLEEQLIRSTAGALPGLLSSWMGSGSTGATVAPTAAATQATGEREKLLAEVSQLRSTFPQIQARLQSELRGLMAGVPDVVAVQVLKDWKADLTRDVNNDPDRTTDIDTPVEQRILLQMQRYGVRIENLDPTLRERLSSGANNGAQLR